MKSASFATGTSAISLSAVKFSIGASVASLVCLLSLHVLSPEFDPSWRMVSEYALGSYSWVLSVMFICWAFSSWALAVAMLNQVTTRWGKIGVGFLIAAGLGEFMAAFFDVTHPLHGLSALIGAPGLPVAAMLLSTHLGRAKPWSNVRKQILLSANLTWISFALFMATMVLLMVTFAQAGGDLSGEPVSTLPDGVIAINGWANRLWIIVYNIWVIIVATQGLRIQKLEQSIE